MANHDKNERLLKSLINKGIITIYSLHIFDKKQ